MISGILMFIVILFIYTHILIHFYVVKENSISKLKDVNGNEITYRCHHKIPYYFDYSHTDLSLNDTYESIPMLEPNVHFFPTHTTSTDTESLHTNLHCRNFYKVTDMSANFILIHPKYTHNFKLLDGLNYSIEKDNIKRNPSFIHKTLSKNEMLFVPNYWLVYYETNGVVEKIQYATLLNQMCFLKHKIKHLR